MSAHTFFCIDAHACGNPVRLVVGGAPLLPNVPMNEKRHIFMQSHDWVRQALMFEPRGHDIMSGAMIYPSSREDCDFGVLFIEVSGCRPMCGAGTMGLVTAALEAGIVTARVPGRLAIETPAGRVDVEYTMNGRYVDEVRLFNVASYLHEADVKVEVPGIGRLTVDISYGGNYYAIVEPQADWRGFGDVGVDDLIAASRVLRDALARAIEPVHPDDERIRGVHHVLWCDKSETKGAHGRAAVFYGEKAIDRSPGGTGTSARLAQLYSLGQLEVGGSYVSESLIGTTFNGRIEGLVDVGKYAGILPSIGGWARVTGHNTIFVDDRDPLCHGFQLA
jgi:4-hydroxyproline epimerase